MKKLIFILNTCLIFYSYAEEWKGAWFPYKPGTVMNMPPMGVKNTSCDDGKIGIETDYDGNPAYYTCYENRLLYLPNPNVHPLLEHEPIPRGYNAMHFCMNESIYYNNDFPTFGPHRPLWGKYGEYSYIPKQRYLHNLEHGAVVMLYHPCANPNEIYRLKKVVKECLFRHIITPDPDLNIIRPMALLAWGNRLTMSKFDLQIVIKFISTYANRGPEKTPRNGQYDFQLLEDAHKVSNDKDDVFCPSFLM